ncbi:hypothetical protein AAFF_G00081000 [Aldrovandia affinis]|uniref:Uncharacterized protein n=1 Tax=Aldrovandia affinis TaxID=143900 RepID=A0AAD7WYG1_9TELE|nr:hypothetical protein AAFF_G00081000 [Aldrovandia affinis]
MRQNPQGQKRRRRCDRSPVITVICSETSARPASAPRPDSRSDAEESPRSDGGNRRREDYGFDAILSPHSLHTHCERCLALIGFYSLPSSCGMGEVAVDTRSVAWERRDAPVLLCSGWVGDGEGSPNHRADSEAFVLGIRDGEGVMAFGLESEHCPTPFSPHCWFSA